MIKVISHKYTVYTFLFLFSFIFNFYYGYRGVLPIDSFLIFDSGYFVLNGKYPFRDFWTITGPLLDYIQSIFFYLFNVNWYSYVFHASCLNFLLVLFSYSFFNKLGLKKVYSIIYSVGVSILAYPSIGTPFPDHHAFIFAVISMYFMILAISEKKKYYYFLTTFFLFFSFLSKQTSSFYLLTFFSFILAIYFFSEKKDNVKNIGYFLFGLVIPLSIFLIFLKFTDTPIKSFFVQYILYPYSIGGERILNLNFDFNNTISQFKFIYLSFIPGLIVSFYILIFKKIKVTNNSEVYISAIFFGTILIFLYSQLLTKNQILIFSLIPICCAFSQIIFEKYYKKKYLIYFLMIIFIYSTFKYHIRFNEDKKFMELNGVNINNFVDGSNLDKSFSGLKWITHLYPKNPEDEINLLAESIKVIKSEKSKKIIITDYQFISSITKNKFSTPNKWHDKISVPGKDNKFYEIYKEFFFSKIKNNKIEKIYFVGFYKEIFFLDLLDSKSCIKKRQINDLLKIYDIRGCLL